MKNTKYHYARDWRHNSVAVKRLLSAIAVLTPLLVFASCTHETYDDNTGTGTGTDKDGGNCTFSFVVNGNSGDTRADLRPADIVAAPARVIELPCGEDGAPFCLVETVTELGDDYAITSTRGTPSNTENFRTTYGEVGLYGAAYVPTATASADTPFVESKDAWCYQYLKDNKTTVWFNPQSGDANTSYVHDYTNDVSESDRSHLKWPDGNELWFFLQAPYDFPAGSGQDQRMKTSKLSPTYYSDGSIGFSYNEPNTPVNGTVTNGAVNQTDFLFTSKRVKSTPGKNPECKILMYHCLTGVKFMVGNKDNNRTTIKSVTLSGIVSSGTCRLTPNYTDANVNGSNSAASGNDSSKSAQCASWDTDGAAKCDYIEVLNITKDNPQDPARTLYLVPQATPDAMIKVTYEVNGVEYTRTSALELNKYEWKAGELHTFTLTVNTLDVDITRSSESAPDIQITNTGNVTAYISASLQANWCAEDGKIVYPYTMTGSEISGLGSNWKKAEGSYTYYYVNPVKAGNSTAQKFFESFTPSPAPATGYEGLHVVLDITAQSVRFIENGSDENAKKADATKLWGSTISGQLGVNPE